MVTFYLDMGVGITSRWGLQWRSSVQPMIVEYELPRL